MPLRYWRGPFPVCDRQPGPGSETSVDVWQGGCASFFWKALGSEQVDQHGSAVKTSFCGDLGTPHSNEQQISVLELGLAENGSGGESPRLERTGDSGDLSGSVGVVVVVAVVVVGRDKKSCPT